MVASTTSVPIWDLVLVPKRLVFISYYFWELIQHLFTSSPFELAPCGIPMSTPATSDSAGSSAKPSSPHGSYCYCDRKIRHCVQPNRSPRAWFECHDGPRDPSSARRYDIPLGTTRSPSTIVPPAVSSLRPPSAGPSAPRHPSARGSVTSSFLTAPSTRPKTPIQTIPRDAGSTIYSPEDDGPVRRVRAGKANSVYSLSSVNEQERHRPAAEDSSTVDEYGSMVSSPAPSISSVSTPELGTTPPPRLAFRGPESSNLLGDSHVGRSPGSRGSSSSRSYATPRAPSRLGRIPEMPTGSSTSSLVRSLPGARPKSSRFPAPKSSATSMPYLTADVKENAQDVSSDSYVTALERTPTKSTYSAGSATSEPLSLTQKAATAQLPRSETDVPLATSALCMQTEVTKKAFSSTLKALPGLVVWIHTTQLLAPDSLTPGPSQENQVIVPLHAMFVPIPISAPALSPALFEP
jgi:hypothetical protein